MRRSRSPHVSHVTRADDEGNGPPEFMCHMWMRERPPHSCTGCGFPATADKNNHIAVPPLMGESSLKMTSGEAI